MKNILLVFTLFSISSIFSSAFAIPRIYTPALEDSASESLSFSIFKDDYSYSDPTMMFEETFRDGDKSSMPFLLLLQFDYPMFNSWVDAGFSANFGLGYSSGRGVFSGDASESETRMNLWTLPMEVGAFVEFDLKYIIFSISAGPSILGVIQNRSDFDHEDEGKNIRQVGYGYYGMGQIKFNLNRIFKKNAFDLFSSYQATRLTMNLEVRHVDYGNFKDDIQISGDSFGLGFSFDFY